MDRLGVMPGREAQHRAGVEPAAQVTAHRHVGPQPEPHRLVQRRAELLDVFASLSARRAASAAG